MRWLLGPLIFILVAAIPSVGTDHSPAQGGPHLIVSPTNGTLEIDRPGTIYLDIKNDANASAASQNMSVQRLPAWLQPGYGTNFSDALGISVELQPKDSVFEMLTGPQLAGSLESGKNRTVGFNLRTDSTAVPGVYPVDLLIAYRRISEVQTLGDPGQPDVAFQYANVSQTFPEEVTVVQGPRIHVGEVKDGIPTGKESELDLTLTNSGDLIATDLRARILSEAPFGSGDGPLPLGNLGPGQSASARFRINTENGTVPGLYALQIGVDYLDGGTARSEELAAVVPVKRQSETGSLLAPAAGIIALVSAAYIVVRTYRAGFRRKRRW